MLKMPLTVLGDPQPLPSTPQEGPNAVPPNPVYIPPSNSTITPPSGSTITPPSGSTITTPNTVAPIVQYSTNSTLPTFNTSTGSDETPSVSDDTINNKRLMIIGGISLIALYLIVSNKR